MLIRDAEVDGQRCDVRLADGLIAAIAPTLPPLLDNPTLDARGGALLPGLHDHHIHLNATAASLMSVRCGPPDVRDAARLIAALHHAPGDDWLRGVGYHASVAGEIDRQWLDRNGPARPVRIQHRSGRMWIFNSLALRELGDGAPADGRLIDGDAWLRGRLPVTPLDLRPVGDRLAALGVTGLTEVTPRNDRADYLRYAQAGLPQHLLVMGGPKLDDAPPVGLASRGAVKLHYHDHDLPPLDHLVAEVARAHGAGRPVASHCVTQAELVVTLAAIEEAGAMVGDRIEHAAIVTPDNADWMARLGLVAVSQPHFIAERGDAYRRDVAAEDRRWLYRLRGLRAAGVGLAAGSDAPFGGLNPWASMGAAVQRPDDLGPDEVLTPEEALALYTGQPHAPAVQRKINIGESADLCLIDRNWAAARVDLAAVTVRATWVAGRLVYGTIASTNPHSSASDAEMRRIDSAI